MEFYAKVIKQGNSLVIPLTKELRALGITEGQWIKIALLTTDVEYSSDYDPSTIGDKILQAIDGTDFNVGELKSLISMYESNKERIGFITDYVRRIRAEKGRPIY